MAQWSSKILNRYVATDIRSFTQATIPDLNSQYPNADYWLAHHFLNSVLRTSFSGRVRQLVAAIVRRTYHAFQYYHEARSLTLRYLHDVDPHNPSSSKYFSAVAAWEAYALQVSMAVDALRRLQDKAVFQKDDGSAVERMYTISNHIKHLSSCTTSGQMSDDDTQPVWLTNSGLASFEVAVSFDEAAEILSELAGLADLLQDPKSVVERASS